MPDGPRLGFFRGSELPRLMVLVGLAVAGLVLLWQAAPWRAVPAGGPPARVDGVPPPIVADSGPEFESVRDRTPIGFRDAAAYEVLLKRTREQTHAELASRARRDVSIAQLYERPAHYRGVPVHILGRCLRVLRYESKLSQTGWLYEAWISTHDDLTYDSQKFPFVCVFEDAPKGFPLGETVSERVVFNGYFLKLMLYQSAKEQPFAPVLVGRIGWTPPRPDDGAAGAGLGGRSLRFWSAVAVGVLFLLTFLRWLAGLARTLGRRSRPTGPPPTDEIAPEALARWVDTMSDDAERLCSMGAEDDENGDPDQGPTPESTPPPR